MISPELVVIGCYVLGPSPVKSRPSLHDNAWRTRPDDQTAPQTRGPADSVDCLRSGSLKTCPSTPTALSCSRDQARELATRRLAGGVRRIGTHHANHVLTRFFAFLACGDAGFHQRVIGERFAFLGTALTRLAPCLARQVHERAVPSDQLGRESCKTTRSPPPSAPSSHDSICRAKPARCSGETRLDMSPHNGRMPHRILSSSPACFDSLSSESSAAAESVANSASPAAPVPRAPSRSRRLHIVQPRFPKEANHAGLTRADKIAFPMLVRETIITEKRCEPRMNDRGSHRYVRVATTRFSEMQCQTDHNAEQNTDAKRRGDRPSGIVPDDFP